MPFSSGNFTPYTPGNPVVDGTDITTDWGNNTINDIASGLSTCILKDGSQTITANIPFSNFKITGLATGTAATDAATVAQVQGSLPQYLTAIGGTGNAITATATPAATLAIGQVYRFLAAAANTSSTTLKIGANTAGAIQTNSAALVGGEIQSGQETEVFVSDAATPVFQLIGNGATLPFIDSLPLVHGSADATKKLRIEVDGQTTATTRVITGPDADSIYGDYHGQCRLTKSGANLLLSPFSGNKIIINSVLQVIPDAGVTLAIGAASASTAYFIYAFMNSGTMTLEFSATAHATQAGTGVEIKSGDATRTLVGWARANASPAWQDDNASYIGVLSYFNRRLKGATNAAGGTGTSSGSIVEIGGRINFGTWPDEIVQAVAHFTVNNSSGATTTTTGIGTDSTSTFSASTFFNNGSVANIGTVHVPGAVAVDSLLSEGFHFQTLNEQVSGGSATNTVTTLTVTVRG